MGRKSKAAIRSAENLLKWKRKASVSVEEGESTVKRQKCFSNIEKEENLNYSSRMLLLSKDGLDSIAELMRCPDCDQSAGCSVTWNSNGSSVDLPFSIKCNNCSNVVVEYKPSGITDLNGWKSKHSAGNIFKIYGCETKGLGYFGYRSLCFYESIRPCSSDKYYRQLVFLQNNMKAFYNEMSPKIFCSVHQFENCEAPLADVAVSFDGSWLTRGHKSNIGVGFIIHAETGFVLDFQVLSKFCDACHKKKKQLSSEAFQEWKAQQHKKCQQNYDGKSSGSMESECAAIMWQRSEEKGFRYTKFIADGDLSAYNAIIALNNGNGPYDAPVVKQEWINHVSKRLGTQLRNLKKDLQCDTTKTGKTVRRSRLTGKRGGLTDTSIDKLTKDFCMNIRHHAENGTVQSMREAVLSGYYHASSSDSNPYHTKCPKGVDSWCFYNKAVAKGKTPDSHNSHNLCLSGLDNSLQKEILRVYLDLATTTLLSRCMQNKSQNLNSELWQKCLKIKYTSLDRVIFAAQDAILQHNFGASNGCLLRRLGLIAKEACEILDNLENVQVP